MPQLKIISYNLNGIRSAVSKGLADWIKDTQYDIYLFQEIKANELDVPKEIFNDLGYVYHTWFSAEKKGYSSVVIYTRIDPLKITNGFNNPDFDKEGRVIFAEYDKFVLANVYFPNGGRGPERIKYKLDFYDELFFNLEKKYRYKKGIIVTGDFNTAHKEIDLARPKENVKTSGFLPEEREWIDKLINLGYVDVFRKFNDKPEQYTYWDQISGARARNIGWRIDYFLVSDDFADKVNTARIHPEVMGSDHCPISIEIELS